MASLGLPARLSVAPHATMASGTPIAPWPATLAAQRLDDALTIDGQPALCDGIVYRADDTEVYRAMGTTSHHPRGAMAVKVW